MRTGKGTQGVAETELAKEETVEDGVHAWGAGHPVCAGSLCRTLAFTQLNSVKNSPKSPFPHCFEPKTQFSRLFAWLNRQRARVTVIFTREGLEGVC